MGALLFFAAGMGPSCPGVIWFFINTADLFALLSWLGTRFKPVSVEQLLRFVWNRGDSSFCECRARVLGHCSAGVVEMSGHVPCA